MSLARIRKGDTVIVTRGNDAGKTGNVLKVDTQAGKAVVFGVNVRTKAVRRSERNEGGLVKMEMPVSLDKLMPYDESSKRGTRVKSAVVDGKKARVAVKSGKTIAAAK